MRGIVIVLAAVLIAGALLAGMLASQRRALFDPALSRDDYPCSWPGADHSGPLDPEFDSWFGGPLRRADEPSLFRKSNARTSATTIRFTFLPSSSAPIVVRIDDVYGPQPRLTAFRDEGQVKPSAGSKQTRVLASSEVAPLRAALASTDILTLEPDSCLSGPDGVIYLIEVAGPDGYRFINRWGVTEGPVYDLANQMYLLTGWANGPQGPDRQDARLRN
ncbi:hypothetical protein [Brevundimonas variabilis]|uniref:Uncharacterized protein n=1 Tax=Brevundimonas variabilis TaxID=74312 RepID=A0A7W9CF29_9CAUL|nr:hypothetical protein [Brevundimonas variabilis]MBB5744474.1 hypothetical protein [Brevundimonas variabilis]